MKIRNVSVVERVILESLHRAQNSADVHEMYSSNDYMKHYFREIGGHHYSSMKGYSARNRHIHRSR